MFRTFCSWLRPKTKEIQKRQFSFIENRKKKVFSHWVLGGQQNSTIPPPIRPRLRNITNLISVIAFFTGSVFLFSSTAPIPHLDRKRRTFLSPQVEAVAGSLFSRVMIESNRDLIVDPSHPVVQHLERIGHHITDSNGLPRHRYVLIESNEVNAFVLPGNFVFVYTGILPIFKNQSGAAMVISHELSHCLAGHSFDSLCLGIPLAILALTTGSWFSYLSQLLVQLPRSRRSEIEADRIGVHLMTKACFDPREASAVFRRMEEMTGGNPEEVDLFSTHPNTASRINLIQELVTTPPIQESCGLCGRMDWSYPGHNFLTTYHYPSTFPRITQEQIQQLFEEKN